MAVTEAASLNKVFPEYLGLGYEAASREALRLVQSASNTGQTLTDLPDRLMVLKRIVDVNTPRRII